MKALVKAAAGVGHVELREVPEPKPQPGQLKIEVKAGAICGTDLHIHDDEYPNCPPVVLGHEMSGVVVEVGERVQRFKVGDRITSETFKYTCGHCRMCQQGLIGLCADRRSMGVHVDGAFAKYVCQREESVHTLPANVDFEAGALSEPTAVAVRAVYERATIGVGDTVLVSGPGCVGLLTVQAAKSLGATVILSGVGGDEKRLALGRDLGADAIVNSVTDSLDVIFDHTAGLGVDVAIECAGSESSLEQCALYARKGAQIVLVGLFGRPVVVDFDATVINEQTLLPSFTYTHDTWERALALMSCGSIKTAPLISDRSPLTDWESAFDAVRHRRGNKYLLLPSD